MTNSETSLQPDITQDSQPLTATHPLQEGLVENNSLWPEGADGWIAHALG